MLSSNVPTPHFLIVEDDPSHADLILMSLEMTGLPHTVSHVADGIRAMDYLLRRADFTDAERPDLVLLDLNLPKMDGLAVLERIKADADLRAIPVVILTTSASEMDRARAYAVNVNSYLTKPGGSEEFVEMMRDLYRYWVGWNQSAPSSARARPAS